MSVRFSWEKMGTIAPILGLVATIIGANYLFTRNVRTDLREQMGSFEKRMEKSDERMETIDARWASLFEKFHILHKDMEKFRLPSKEHS